MNFSAGLSLLTDLVLKNLGSATVIPIYDTKSQQPDYYDFSAVTFWNNHTYWETFSWNFSNWNGSSVQRIYPGSLSDSNITEKSDVISWVKEEHEIMSDEGLMS